MEKQQLLLTILADVHLIRITRGHWFMVYHLIFVAPHPLIFEIIKVVPSDDSKAKKAGISVPSRLIYNGEIYVEKVQTSIFFFEIAMVFNFRKGTIELNVIYVSPNF